jgi:outer membrane protein
MKEGIMNKLTVLISLAILLVLMTSIPLSAQQPAKIGIIDSQRAFEQSEEGKKAATQVQERDTKIKSELKKLDDSVRLLETRLGTAQLTMTQEALFALQSDLEKKRTERKRYEEDATQDMARLRASLISRLQAEMLTIIKAMRKEKGFDFIMETTSIVDGDPALDITDELIRRYNASKAGILPVKK